MGKLKIISGGQTGADIGALTAARELGLETGGTAPRGWMTEEGPRETVLRGFGLVEAEAEGYAPRTRANVANADGTLLIGQYETGGSALTYITATELNKPLFHVPFSARPEEPLDETAKRFRSWLTQHNVKTLNVAGDRESASPGIGEFARNFLLGALNVFDD